MMNMEFVDPAQLCDLCNDKLSVLKCFHCQEYLCAHCDANVHSREPLHDRSIFTEGFERPIPYHYKLDDGLNLHYTGKFHLGNMFEIATYLSNISIIKNLKFCLEK